MQVKNISILPSYEQNIWVLVHYLWLIPLSNSWDLCFHSRMLVNAGSFKDQGSYLLCFRKERGPNRLRSFEVKGSAKGTESLGSRRWWSQTRSQRFPSSRFSDGIYPGPPPKLRESLSQSSTNSSSALQRVWTPLLPTELSHSLFLLRPAHNSLTIGYFVYLPSQTVSYLRAGAWPACCFFPVSTAKCLTCIVVDVTAFDAGTNQLMVLFFFIWI